MTKIEKEKKIRRCTYCTCDQVSWFDFEVFDCLIGGSETHPEKTCGTRHNEKQ